VVLVEVATPEMDIRISVRPRVSVTENATPPTVVREVTVPEAADLAELDPEIGINPAVRLALPVEEVDVAEPDAKIGVAMDPEPPELLRSEPETGIDRAMVPLALDGERASVPLIERSEPTPPIPADTDEAEPLTACPEVTAPLVELAAATCPPISPPTAR
jgi:hypothetical protein